MGERYRCDHCGWSCGEYEMPEHPVHGHFCLDCWDEGFVSGLRPELGPLIEACMDREPTPRAPKPLIDWTEEEWARHERIERFRSAHEAAPVRLATTIEDASQLGFDWMREEFRVAPIRDGKKKTKS